MESDETNNTQVYLDQVASDVTLDDFSSIFDKLRTLVSGGRTEAAIKILLEYLKKNNTFVKYDDHYRDLLNLSNRLHILKRKLRNGTISEADANIENNKINVALLEIFDLLHESPAS